MATSRRQLTAIAFLCLVCGDAQNAHAGEARDYCADRPGLNTTVCVLDRGRIAIESSFIDWSENAQGGALSESFGFGSTLLRYGVTDTLEVRVDFDGYAIARSRDRLAGVRDRQDGMGDVGLSIRQNLRNPDGSGFAVSVMPYVTLPIGADGQSAGDWGAGILLPASFEITKGVSLAVTPELNAAVDSDGDGRHVSFGAAIGLGFSLTDSLSMAIETQVIRDQDPDGRSTEALAGLSLAWMANDDLQFDVGLVRGLSDESTDWQLYTGIARRF